MQKKIISIYYHNPDARGFEKMIKWYKRLGYRFISLYELQQKISSSVNKEKCAIITLDDGWRGNLQLLPIIEKHNIPICIFVAIEPIFSGNFWWEYITKDRGKSGMIEFKNLEYEDFYKQLNETKNRIRLDRSAITQDELHQLSLHKLVTIQPHTYNHPILTSLPENMMRDEIIESKETLENLLNKNMYAFSYPNGSYSQREISVVCSSFEMAFTTEQRHIYIGDDKYQLPRIALTGDYHRDLLKVWGIWPYMKKIYDLLMHK